jgi:hypothetical protein
MSKPSNRSDERKPFDSRRTKVTLVTPRDSSPTSPPPTSAENDDATPVDAVEPTSSLAVEEA